MKNKNRGGYPLSQSPLYKLESKKKLSEILRCTLKDINYLKKNGDKNYHILWVKDKKTGRKRKCECPNKNLKPLHRRFFDLLTRIEPPKYLHSGIKGRSYITNAEQHLTDGRMLTMDVQKFFPSTKGWHLFEFFNDILLCSKDVSHTLTALITFKNHIPTGSPASQVLAFYSHYEMFNSIHNLACTKNLSMTCYVDDIAISGNKANKSTLYAIRGLIKRRGLNSPRQKERFYNIGKPRNITGSIIDHKKLRLPNNKHKNIFDARKLIMQSTDMTEKLSMLTSNLGRINAAGQADPKFKNIAKHIYIAKHRLEKTS